MRVVVENTLTNRQNVAFDGPAGFTVGRDEACDVRLESRFVSGVHFKVERAEVGWEVELFANVSPVEINGKEIKPGQKVQFRDEAVVKIMEFVLTLDDGKAEGTGAVGAGMAGGTNDEAREQITELLNVLHANVLRRLDLRIGAISSADMSQSRTDQLNKIIDDLLLSDFRREVFESDLTPALARIALRGRVAEWLIKKTSRETAIVAEWHGLGENPELEAPIEQAVVQLANKAGIYTGKAIPHNADEMVDAIFWKAGDAGADAVLRDVLENVRTYLIISYIKKVLYDIIFGLGPLEDLLRSPSITEIMRRHAAESIYIEPPRPHYENPADVPLR